VQTNYDDYRELEGSKMKHAFRVTEKTSSYTIIEHVEEVRLNVPVDQSLFMAPSFKVRIQH
jgi:hypothetical protein